MANKKPEQMTEAELLKGIAGFDKYIKKEEAAGRKVDPTDYAIKQSYKTALKKLRGED